MISDHEFSSQQPESLLFQNKGVRCVMSACRGNGFWPTDHGGGRVEEIGEDAGLGFNVNMPFSEKGLGDAEYLAVFEVVSGWAA